MKRQEVFFMLEKNIAQLLNEQVNKELYSAYLYLDFANYYADEGLDGFAHWYEIQAQEERDHAMMIRRYTSSSGSIKCTSQVPTTGFLKRSPSSTIFRLISFKSSSL